jgi:uncharacterized membrane protein YqjE
MGAPASGLPAPGGLLDSLRAMGRTVNEALHVRGELFAVELREELARRTDRLLLAAVAFGFLHTALLLLTMLVAVVFWDTHRIAALAAMTALYLACGIGAVLRLRQEIAASPKPFAASLAELNQDLDRGRPA